MTRTGRALVIGQVVVLAFALWTMAVAADPVEPTRGVADLTAAAPPASAGAVSPMLTLPVLADIVEPLVLAALCGAALAFFSGGPRHTARARVRRRWRS